MKVKDQRGQHYKAIGKKNRDNIKRFFEENPAATRQQCCEKLGLTYTTIQNHLKSLSKEL